MVTGRARWTWAWWTVQARRAGEIDKALSGLGVGAVGEGGKLGGIGELDSDLVGIIRLCFGTGQI